MRSKLNRKLYFSLVETLVFMVLITIIISLLSSSVYLLINSHREIQERDLYSQECTRFQSDFNKLFFFLEENSTIKTQEQSVHFSCEHHYPEFVPYSPPSSLETSFFLHKDKISLEVRKKPDQKIILKKRYFNKVKDISFKILNLENSQALEVTISFKKAKKTSIEKTTFIFLNQKSYT
ncbi:hypothetical protein AB751O23_BJ_00060 [Chlamydiales bacterium SCGC AB-751-O23]|nr:hypothetical protein AB751O23_BJ_00060 [Chlamydiales bacterium SCGC AB-751-O23]